MSVGAVRDWGQAVQTAFADGLAILFAGIPKIVGFLVILIVGWIIAAILYRVVADVLRAVKFNQLAGRAGLSRFVQDMGVNMDASGFMADIVKWFIRLIVLVAAFDALGLPAISNVLNQFLLWIPNLIVAMVVLVVGGLLARAAADVVRAAGAEAGVGNPGFLAAIAKYAVWAFAIIVAVNQIGIASTLVNTLFTGFVFALALAFALAFGLGGRDTAAQIVQNWYQKSQSAAPKMAQAMQDGSTVRETRPSTAASVPHVHTDGQQPGAVPAGQHINRNDPSSRMPRR